MRGRISGRWRSLLFAAAAAGAMCLAPIAIERASGAPRGDPRTYNVKKKAFGRTFQQWASAWWQWTQSIPSSVNPLFDESGERVSVGQQGPVWFLCGVLNESGTASRNATIPAGKALFFPVVNYVGFNLHDDPAPSTLPTYQAAGGLQMAAIVDGSLHVTLDGSEIRNVDRMLVQGTFQDLAMPDDNVFVATGIPAPGGPHGPAFQVGYWCMLRPLSPGRHTVNFGGTFAAPYNFTVNVTYVLDVVDHDWPPEPPGK